MSTRHHQLANVFAAAESICAGEKEQWKAPWIGRVKFGNPYKAGLLFSPESPEVSFQTIYSLNEGQFLFQIPGFSWLWQFFTGCKVIDSQRIVTYLLNKLKRLDNKYVEELMKLKGDQVKNLLSGRGNQELHLLAMLSDALTIIIAAIKENQRQNNKTVVSHGLEARPFTYAADKTSLPLELSGSAWSLMMELAALCLKSDRLVCSCKAGIFIFCEVFNRCSCIALQIYEKQRFIAYTAWPLCCWPRFRRSRSHYPITGWLMKPNIQKKNRPLLSSRFVLWIVFLGAGIAPNVSNLSLLKRWAATRDPRVGQSGITPNVSNLSLLKRWAATLMQWSSSGSAFFQPSN